MNIHWRYSNIMHSKQWLWYDDLFAFSGQKLKEDCHESTSLKVLHCFIHSYTHQVGEFCITTSGARIVHYKFIL